MMRVACLLLFLGLLPGLRSAEADPPAAVGRSAAPPVEELRIADERGDHGPPNPFRHYPRGSGFVRMSWIFDTLIWKDRDGPVPALAQFWNWNKAKTACTFELHPEARWHDGCPLTADDVAFSIDYYRRHPYVWADVSVVRRVEVRDARRVTLHLAHPYAPFLAEIGGSLPILPRHIWEGVDDPLAFAVPEAFVGSGPYRFRDFDEVRGSYLFEAFADYYQGSPRVKRLIYLRSTNPLISLANGQADLAAIRPEMAEPLRRKGLTVIEERGGWVRKLMINHDKFPCSDRRFRQALAYAVDLGGLIAKSQRGFAVPASPGLLAPGHPFYNPSTPVYAHDPGRARALLAELGYRSDTAGVLRREGRALRLELISSSIAVAGGSGGDRDGLILKEQLEAIGIQVELRVLEQAAADQRLARGAFDLALSGQGGIGGDPKILNEMILPGPGGAFNSARFGKNPELVALLDEQLQAVDEDKRRALVFRIQELLAEELPTLPLYYPANLSAYRPEKGIDWYYSKSGLGKGVPIPQNKQALLP
ncbi:ABC transporter substrate-binding protein [Trichloromonas sp.]|uniref:ABC transporter substrate-binding protein n=1 Tax=Trichloromonas sp. TaxID=3069249 RepID=UPI002A4B2636|nr:ABC transporter substrate-binding protein [Trichloromonas sp.]